MYLCIYSLVGCYFSQKAELIMMDYKLGKKLKVIKVLQKDKSKYKKKNKMETFPQIFIVDSKSKIKIGGSDKLENILRIINEIKTYEITINNVCALNDLIN